MLAFQDEFPRNRMTLSRDRLFLALLALSAAYSLVWPIYRLGFPIEIAPNEGWNAYHADAAMGAAPLYPPADALIVNNYPPLSFYVLGLLSRATGIDALYIGRALSVLALFGTALVIILVVRGFGGNRSAAMIGGAWFVAVMAGAFNRYVGMDDPLLVGLFVMGLALNWFLARAERGQSAVPPILLMVLAGFWKHNLIVIPATVLLWLLLREGGRAWKPVVIGIVAAVLGLAVCVALYGDPFIANMLTPRRYSLLRSFSGLGRLQWILPGLIIAGIWAWRERATVPARFLSLFGAIGLVSYFVQWATEGVGDNVQFELLLCVSIALGLAYDRADVLARTSRFSAAQLRAGMVIILLIRLLATGRVMPALVLFDPDYRAEVHRHAALVQREVARVAAISGLVGCSNKVVCRMAGKDWVVDDFKIEEIVKTGLITQARLDQIMRQRKITYDVTDPGTFIDSLNRDLFAELGARVGR